MDLLEHLWDDTVAGPPPDSGLGKLRKCSSFSPSSLSAASAPAPGGLQVTRSITILRSISNASAAAGAPSPPSSAASSPRGPWTAPDSPLAPPTPRGDWQRLRRKPTPAPAEVAEAAEPRSPTVYDWVVISSLDR